MTLLNAFDQKGANDHPIQTHHLSHIYGLLTHLLAEDIHG